MGSGDAQSCVAIVQVLGDAPLRVMVLVRIFDALSKQPAFAVKLEKLLK